MQDLFVVQRRCLRKMGHVCRTTTTEKPWHEAQNPWSCWHILKLILVASAQLPMTYYSIYHINDLSLATAGLSIICTNMLTIIKISTFLWYKNQFMRLMTKYTQMYNNIQDPYEKAVLTAANGLSGKLASTYFLSLCCTGLYFMITPILKNIWAKLNENTLVLELPMPMRFPFNFESSPGYEIAYIYTGCVTLVVVMYSSAVDGLFLDFALNLRAHFKVLQNMIQSNKFLSDEIEIHRDIVKMVRYHTTLLDMGEQVRNIYGPIIFGQFLMTSLEMCVIMYQLVTNMDKYMVLLIYISFLFSIMMQLFIYCNGGEIIRNESLQISTAVQLSNWYNLSPRNRRMFCLIMRRSQRAVVIKAVFYEASLANFMTIIKAAMSYITLIQSIE